MKLSEIKEVLGGIETITFQLPDGTFVPEHFHVTEIGSVNRKFIDCGGTVRNESFVNFQLWDANDFEHRLKPQKLKHIIELSESVIDIEDQEIEVEYQSDTIGRYDLAFNGKYFELLSKKTACLADDQCGVPKRKISLKELQSNSNCCSPESGCC